MSSSSDYRKTSWSQKPDVSGMSDRISLCATIRSKSDILILRKIKRLNNSLDAITADCGLTDILGLLATLLRIELRSSLLSSFASETE